MDLIIKRAMDLFISLLALMILSLLFGIIALVIKLDDRGPVYFRQKRAGKNGSIFSIYKFRTMIEGAEKKGAGYAVEENDSRITRTGKILRKYSIDELPQLFNVLKGDMSIVGPRPTLPYQIERYDQKQRKRLEVKPGMTGWAQIHGRNAISWPERIEYDLWYVENWSVLLDIKIMFRTIFVILRKQGLYKKGNIADPISKVNKEE